MIPFCWGKCFYRSPIEVEVAHTEVSTVETYWTKFPDPYGRVAFGGKHTYHAPKAAAPRRPFSRGRP